MADADIDRLNADLLAAGLHQSQINPVHFPERCDISPATPAPCVVQTDPDKRNKLARWIDKLFERTWEDRMRD